MQVELYYYTFQLPNYPQYIIQLKNFKANNFGNDVYDSQMEKTNLWSCLLAKKYITCRTTLANLNGKPYSCNSAVHWTISNTGPLSKSLGFHVSKLWPLVKHGIRLFTSLVRIRIFKANHGPVALWVQRYPMQYAAHELA